MHEMGIGGHPQARFKLVERSQSLVARDDGAPGRFSIKNRIIVWMDLTSDGGPQAIAANEQVAFMCLAVRPQNFYMVLILGKVLDLEAGGYGDFGQAAGFLQERALQLGAMKDLVRGTIALLGSWAKRYTVQHLPRKTIADTDLRGRRALVVQEIGESPLGQQLHAVRADLNTSTHFTKTVGLFEHMTALATVRQSNRAGQSANTPT